MARHSPIMPLAFEARQKLDLPVMSNPDRLSEYLLQQERVVGAMLDPKKLTLLAPGSYRYNVTSFKVFQLEVNPVVSITAVNSEGRLRMNATDSELDGLGLIDDFELTLNAILEITPKGLEGEALLGVSVSPPPLLQLIPKKVLERTGESILSTILKGIKARVRKQLVDDFTQWCEE